MTTSAYLFLCIMCPLDATVQLFPASSTVAVGNQSLISMSRNNSAQSLAGNLHALYVLLNHTYNGHGYQGGHNPHLSSFQGTQHAPQDTGNGNAINTLCHKICVR